jgi:hypothetical protein
MVMLSDDARSTLYAYTLARGDPGFLHQHVVDALCAQEADATTPRIRLTFALVGLYLHVEAQCSGRQVQQVHAALARRRPPWPNFVTPASRGALTADDVLIAPEGPERDAMIEVWCAGVWAAYASCRPAVIEFLERYNSTKISIP